MSATAEYIEAQDELTESMEELIASLPEEAQENTNELFRILGDGGSFGDLYGIDEERLEAVYSVAHTLYGNGKFEDAATMFRFLCLMEHAEERYWMGLGATEQMLGNYEKALEAYAQATLLDIDDPRPQIQAGYCLIKLELFEGATQALEGALLAENIDYQTRIQAEAMLARIEGEALDHDA